MTLQLALSLLTIAGLVMLYFEIRKIEPAIMQVGKTAGTANSVIGDVKSFLGIS